MNHLLSQNAGFNVGLFINQCNKYFRFPEYQKIDSLSYKVFQFFYEDFLLQNVIPKSSFLCASASGNHPALK